MDLFSRDEILLLLKHQSNILRINNYDNACRLSKKRGENRLLEKVVYDYKKHNEMLLNLQKQKQEQIEFLLSYIDQSLEEAGINESMLAQAKYEQLNLLKELDSIASSIDELRRIDVELM